MNTIKHFLLFVTSTALMYACGSENQETNEQEANLIEITSQQFATDSMQLGKIETRTFESTVKCNGTIVSLPNGIAKANTPVSGVIKNIHCHNGQFVEKNQILLEIAGNETIDIQQEFAEASANYKLFKNEYERMKSLYVEKVTSEKDFLFAESEFIAARAKYNGLKLKIEAMGFSASKFENGEFYASFSIKSPISGYISNLQTNIGSYCDTQTELLEVINTDMFQIKLSLFANDIINLKNGQSIRYKYANSKNVYFATISSIGVVIDNETKSIECYAKMNDNKQINTIANEFVAAEIITSIDTVTALPSSAIIKNENRNFILFLNKQKEGKYFFQKIEVETGRQFDGFTEIVKPNFEGMILTSGIYNISF